ncbi:MAG: OsmC family protein [Candidatus Thermoplasmatota archaeon]|nr:OsmC family protein [Candidatus Thermoplasmatota archaeon]
MAYIRPTKGLALVGFTDSGHQVAMDTKKAVGGLETAGAPMEMLLQSLMGCTAMDVISILKKMRVDYDSFEVQETNEKAEAHPKVFTSIHLVFKFKGQDLDHEKIIKAVHLSRDRYCPVTDMLKGSVKLTQEITVNGEKIDG